MVEEKLLINEEQAKGLVLRLSEIGLFLRRPTGVESGPFGWIDVASPQKNHPKTDAVGEKCNIGFLGEKYLFFEPIFNLADITLFVGAMMAFIGLIKISRMKHLKDD